MTCVPACAATGLAIRPLAGAALAGRPPGAWLWPCVGCGGWASTSAVRPRVALGCFPVPRWRPAGALVGRGRRIPPALLMSTWQTNGNGNVRQGQAHSTHTAHTAHTAHTHTHTHTHTQWQRSHNKDVRGTGQGRWGTSIGRSNVTRRRCRRQLANHDHLGAVLPSRTVRYHLRKHFLPQLVPLRFIAWTRDLQWRVRWQRGHRYHLWPARSAVCVWNSDRSRHANGGCGAGL